LEICKKFDGKVEGENCFGRSRRRLVKNINMDSTEVRLVGVE